MNIQSKKPEIIALDFYDGAIEGFAISLKEIGPCYFKLVAWDENQDQRLFVVVSIVRLIFDELLKLLKWSDDKSYSKIWLPNFGYEISDSGLKVEKIIECCKSEIKLKGILVLCDKIDGDFLNIFTINDELICAINKAIKQPVNLSFLLKKIETKQPPAKAGRLKLRTESPDTGQ